MGQSLTKEEVQKRLTENFAQKVILIGDYVNRRTKIRLKCLECNYEWDVSPQTVIYNDYKHKCPNCGLKTGQFFNCAYCGKEIYRQSNKIKRNKSGYFYCSQECGNLHKNQLRREAGEWEDSLKYREKAFKYYEHKCIICGWNEDERILEIHHIDSDRSNNDLENLCILCPTCHRKITLKYYTLDLENKVLLKNKEVLKNKDCFSEIKIKNSLSQRKVERPSREELKKLVREFSFSEIGRKYGVSRTTISRWCKFYDLPYTKCDIKKYSEEEWNKL